MTRRTVLRGAAAAVVIAGAGGASSGSRAQAADPTLQPSGQQEYQLAWSDEFTGTALDTSNWFYRQDTKGLSACRPENVSVDQGCLRIALKKEAAAGMEYTTGGVVTRQLFGYGYYEVTAKLWHGAGFHPSFWQLGLSAYSAHVPDYVGPSNAINELDGFEVNTHEPSHVMHNLHWYTPAYDVISVAAYDQVDTSDGFHVYGYEWTPTHVRFFVDGVQTGEAAYHGPHAMQNVWLSSIGLTPPVDESDLPGQDLYQYFRYYRPVWNPLDGVDGTIVVDNDEPGYAETGTWVPSPGPYGFQDKETKVARTVAATATWTPVLPVDAEAYQVAVWNPSYPAAATSARYEVTHDAGATAVDVDLSTAGQQWVDLGTFEMSPGASHGVTASQGPGNAGSLRVDATRFVPTTLLTSVSAGYREIGNGWITEAGTGPNGRDLRLTSGGAGARVMWTAQPQTGLAHLRVWMPANTGGLRLTMRNGWHHVVKEIEEPVAAGWVDVGTVTLTTLRPCTLELRPLEDDGVWAGPVSLTPIASPSTPPPSTPAAPSFTLQSHPDTGRIDLDYTWDVDPSVAGYHVFLDGAQLTWQPVVRGRFSISSLTFGLSYDLSVQAVGRNGERTMSPVTVATMPTDAAAPATPTSLSVEPGGRSAAVKWARNTEYDVAGYHIYVDGVRRTTEPQAWSRGGTVVEGLPPGTVQTVGVTAIDRSGNESGAATASVTPVDAFDVRVGDDGYVESGLWEASGLAGWAGTTCRATEDPNGAAGWQAQLDSAGAYAVAVWYPAHTTSTVAAEYSVEHQDGMATFTVDQTAGGNEWLALGTYSFATTAEVRVRNTAGEGWLRSNAVRFQP
ncbi:golvesin C-terminal-like domain-containing protein [Occultella gossypii]|uniref:Family 16 glycosylhydrolase n=1 Tax=Occultella gossypii TaxID=2800820 RepID=A0ABS7S6Z0_9MICO|nr:family 16 glycosylhydrolase [Occultella gossypii]MBZ2196109.1 family 16 glycosylhydrolase [Occultella gossypii]